MDSSRCAVQNCSNRGDNITGISMHYCALSTAERPKWIWFVHLHRANFNPKGIFPVCSAHFAPDCFQRAANKEKSYPVLSEQSGRQRRPMKVSLHVLEER